MVVCRDPENDGWFELSERTVVCGVQAVVQKEQAERQANQNYKPTPGEILNVVYTKEEPAAASD